MSKELPATAFNPYLEPGEQIRYVAYGVKQPNALLFLVLIFIMLLPALLFLVMFTRYYLVALTDRRFIALRFRNFWGRAPTDARVARGHLKVSAVIEYRLADLPPIKILNNPLLTKITILDPAKRFVVKFRRFGYGGKNNTNAREIAAALSNKPAPALPMSAA